MGDTLDLIYVTRPLRFKIWFKLYLYIKDNFTQDVLMKVLKVKTWFPSKLVKEDGWREVENDVKIVCEGRHFTTKDSVFD